MTNIISAIIEGFLVGYSTGNIILGLITSVGFVVLFRIEDLAREILKELKRK